MQCWFLGLTSENSIWAEKCRWLTEKKTRSRAYLTIFNRCFSRLRARRVFPNQTGFQGLPLLREPQRKVQYTHERIRETI